MAPSNKRDPPPEELIRIRAKEAAKLKNKWAVASDETLKEQIDLSLFNHDND
jgi:hypothetical protein